MENSTIALFSRAHGGREQALRPTSVREDLIKVGVSPLIIMYSFEMDEEDDEDDDELDFTLASYVEGSGYGSLRGARRFRAPSEETTKGVCARPRFLACLCLGFCLSLASGVMIGERLVRTLSSKLSSTSSKSTSHDTLPADGSRITYALDARPGPSREEGLAVALVFAIVAIFVWAICVLGVHSPKSDYAPIAATVVASNAEEADRGDTVDHRAAILDRHHNWVLPRTRRATSERIV